MIWFFLAGMIAGAVGWHMFVMWYGRRIKKADESKVIDVELTKDEPKEILPGIFCRVFDSKEDADAYAREMKNKIENRRNNHD